MGTERVCSSLHALTRCRLSAVLFCSWLLSAQPYEFPEGCEWAERSVTCVGSGDVKVPLEVSTKTHNFTLRGYTVALLPERAISPNGTDAELQTLSLTHNNIQTIETCAFCGLQVLRVLDLSHNFLKIVSPSAFLDLGKLRTLSVNDALIGTGAAQLGRALSMHPLRNLNRLELAGNALLAMPLHGFGNLDLSTLVLSNNSLEALDKTNVSNLKAFKKIRVYLSMNPFRCDCDHWEFYSWLKNSSQCADASGVVCAYPEDKRGSLVENMTCKTSDLEAVSYVFLGIVLALIGVVFLMVLYLNRRGIKRWLNNIREACRDQMEVYHYRYEQDSDPRLANVDV